MVARDVRLAAPAVPPRPHHNPSAVPERRVQAVPPAPARVATMRGLLDHTTRAGRTFERLLEIAPGAATLLIISSLFWGALLLPRALAAAILAFDLFWLFVSYRTTWNAFISRRRMRRAVRTDWQHEHAIAEREGRAFASWADIYHVVVIPNYKEPISILRRTLASIAAQQNAGQIIVVLAMEAREQGSGQKARQLEAEFQGSFHRIFSTFHPADIAGEVAGKSANENWAARIAKRHLVDELEYDLANLTVSSCDADTVFHPAYYACISYHFATDRRRHRTFWQSPILLKNNFWESPAPIRVSSMLADLHILGNLARRSRMFFPQSTYTLSMQMAHDAGYWDTDIIPEDWHMFLKCFYTFSGQVEMAPVYLPTGNDAVRAGSTWVSLREAYHQKKRHAWGASDIPYAVRHALAHPEIGRWRRARRVIALCANHLLWSTNWFLLSIGWWLPSFLRELAGEPAQFGRLESVARLALLLCLLPYAAGIYLDRGLRPARVQPWGPWRRLNSALMWFSLPITSFFLSTLPALEAQTRLMLGKRLEYRVTPKS